MYFDSGSQYLVLVVLPWLIQAAPLGPNEINRRDIDKKNTILDDPSFQSISTRNLDVESDYNDGVESSPFLDTRDLYGRSVSHPGPQSGEAGQIQSREVSDVSHPVLKPRVGPATKLKEKYQDATNHPASQARTAFQTNVDNLKTAIRGTLTTGTNEAARNTLGNLIQRWQEIQVEARRGGVRAAIINEQAPGVKELFQQRFQKFKEDGENVQLEEQLLDHPMIDKPAAGSSSSA
ncbi:MAG: hypothetical protein M1822_006075 [Bathelium mastoideum]|nr:MAG: hypothetical protein M1822_006075 [Bathelium mastoideum]